MERVGSHAGAGNLGIHPGPAASGVLGLLENQERRALAEKAKAEADADRAAAEKAKREAEEATAIARKAMAEANLARLRELQGFQRLRAPFDGVVTQVMADAGQVLAEGQPLLMLARAGEVEAEVFLPEALADAARRTPASLVWGASTLPLTLREVYGFTCEEIGVTLGISRDAVKMALFRGREGFRRIYLGREATDER